MSPEQIGLLGIGILLVSIFCGVWIGVAMAVIGLLGCIYLADFDKTTLLSGLIPLRTISSYTLSTLPTFILMGAIISNTGVAEDVYNTFYKWIGHWRGGLAMTTTVACGAFAACCGSSLATAASIGKIDALVFIGGLFIGVFIFAEGYPLWEELFKAKFLGTPKISEVIGLSDGLMALGFILMAIAAFWMGEWFEKRRIQEEY